MFCPWNQCTPCWNPCCNPCCGWDPCRCCWRHNIAIHHADGGKAHACCVCACCGARVRLTAEPDTGYRFVEWKVVHGGITIRDNEFCMPDNAVGIEPVFARV